MKVTDFAALTFDCYGTLIDWESGIAAELSAWCGRHEAAHPEDLLLECFAKHETAQEVETPTMLYPELLAATLRRIGAELGVPVSDSEAEDFGASVARWPAFPDSAEALQYLKQHYKLVILSNVDRQSFAHSNAKLGVDFDAIVTAQDVGSYKPNLANFRAMIKVVEELGVAKDKILHTAQSLHHDMVPAQAIGLTTAWINRRAAKEGWGATTPPPREVTPDFEVPSMADFVELHKQHLTDS